MKLRHLGRIEVHLLCLGLSGPLPALLAGYVLGRAHGASAALGSTAVCIALALWIWAAFSIRTQVVRSLESVASLLAALRQGDFSVRGRHGGESDALGAALSEFNGLAKALAHQRTSAVEASTLLGKVMTEIDVGIFAFDRMHRLKLVNRTGERLVSNPTPPALGASAVELGLAELLQGPTPRTVNMTLARGTGQWELRRSTFRLQGLPHELIVLSDLRRALREEERLAWQRLVRVLGHELNNSLAPIRSIAADLQGVLRMEPSQRPFDFEDDLTRGLAVIERRAVGLDRFMTSYAALARLPAPRLAPVDVGSWVRRVIELERRLPVRWSPGPSLTIKGDGDQLDQLLINLVQNAVDAALETQGNVEICWRKRGSHHLEVTILDEGPGVAHTKNLFVPFFTTKPEGSGIGLVLSRQICEAHRGTLTLESRTDRTGALARLLLPLQ